MTISLFSTSNDNGIRTCTFIKNIDINFMPDNDFIYFDEENKVVYAIKSIYFTENKISAIVSKLSDSRVEIVSTLFS